MLKYNYIQRYLVSIIFTIYIGNIYIIDKKNLDNIEGIKIISYL